MTRRRYAECLPLCLSCRALASRRQYVEDGIQKKAVKEDLTGSQSAVSLSSVGVTYPNGTIALEPLDLKFNADQMTVLLGRSGAGKSSLLRSLNLLVRRTSGTVATSTLGTLDTKDKIRDHRRETAMIYQQHQLIGRRTALQNVLTGRMGRHSTLRTLFPFSKEERLLALACLDRVDLFEKALIRCDSLSGGQQQRVGIARALAQQPQLILADELVASLDPASSVRVLSILRDICSQDSIPVILSLHQIDYARDFADRIVGLSSGRVVFDGPPQDLSETALREIYGDS
ncbi:phosphonate ABC transporter ATP-binding protein [Labrenzia polysiphoniae]|uniref:Phosphonate ABC transporter ATP-binding protein n=2 Tax=Roseibium polysiphoniae TaxID=2571221 RepID=A0ABR9CCX3_9HYPH|nr:phosphonate ABC transporter ATP-binding protein [Roseibium polysiphoniae]